MTLTATIHSVDDRAQVALLGRLQDGSPDAMDEAIRVHRAKVTAVVRSFRFDDATVEDIVQTVWMRLFQCSHQIRNPESLGAWLGQVARRESISVWHGRQRLQPVEDVTVIDPGVAWEDDDPLELAVEHEAARRAFASLPDEMRRLLDLALDDDRSYSEIAQILRRPIGSIGPSRARALARLRKAYERWCEDKVAG
jgi:RNA polymerase sigma factor (sigma-70 family)